MRRGRFTQVPVQQQAVSNMSLKRSSNGKAREASLVILRLAGLAASARLALR